MTCTLGAGLGGYAEYKCLPENAPMAIKLANLTLEQAAGVPVGGPSAPPGPDVSSGATTCGWLNRGFDISPRVAYTHSYKLVHAAGISEMR